MTPRPVGGLPGQDRAVGVAHWEVAHRRGNAFERPLGRPALLYAGPCPIRRPSVILFLPLPDRLQFLPGLRCDHGRPAALEVLSPADGGPGNRRRVLQNCVEHPAVDAPGACPCRLPSRGRSCRREPAWPDALRPSAASRPLQSAGCRPARQAARGGALSAKQAQISIPPAGRPGRARSALDPADRGKLSRSD